MANTKGKWISVKEMAEALGVSDRTIRRRMDKGLITQKKVGRNYLVFLPEEELEQPKEQPGREPKEKAKQEETTANDNYLLDVLINQLAEKDKLIKELNERIREAHILANGRLLPPPKEEQEEEIFEVTRKTNKKKDYTFLLYILGVLSLSALVYSIIVYTGIGNI